MDCFVCVAIRALSRRKLTEEHHSQEQAFRPVPQRISFLVGWASCPPVEDLLRMVQDLSISSLRTTEGLAPRLLTEVGELKRFMGVRKRRSHFDCCRNSHADRAKLKIGIILSNSIEKIMQCELCDRQIEALTAHHLIPKQNTKRKNEDPGPTIDICSACHRQIHSLFDNKHLAQELNTLEKLKNEPQLERFISWVKKQKPDKKIQVRGKKN